MIDVIERYWQIRAAIEPGSITPNATPTQLARKGAHDQKQIALVAALLTIAEALRRNEPG